ncbi:hypothetical protein [Pectobacterium punjabense]|uniref:hypothetical protein n=1 Tax=Pectobacterium punjabense TaxID=2108399 RepID=UPI001968BA79|nr:hypothetical protein [Pectobacterium punjabense]MBN3137434.1 hypothetical protein [Pectobacterium punjabense]MCE5380448.1 hypothetical protein [Pectobacterium punjabense]
MAIIAYPDWLPLAQKPNKNWTRDTGFRTDNPQVGAPIFQKLTDDLKDTMALTWILNREQHRAFTQWLKSAKYLDNCVNWFSMPMSTSGGDTGVEVQEVQEVQEVHFIDYPQWNQSGNVFTWTGNVVCRKVNNSDDEFDYIIVELPRP